MEHRARLSILKSAVDELCRHGSATQAEGMLEGLPDSFISALKRIEKMPTFWKYPVFWQVFLWGWGGFLLTDNRETELAMVAAEAGLTPDEAEHALSVYDLLFPIESSSWIQKMPSAAYEFVKMVPWPFAGLGAYRRLRVYGWKSHSECPGTGYTASDLARRHNHAYELLSWGAQNMPK